MKNVLLIAGFLKIFIFGLIWLGIVAFLSAKKHKSLTYLLFFTVFYIYIYKVLDSTIFEFQSLLIIKYFMPDLMLNGLTAVKGTNLVPLLGLTARDIRTSLLNILLFMPFGFGLPFITSFGFKKIVVIGTLFSIAIEFLQFISGFMAQITFRITDINDVIFNTIGVAIGYVLFFVFVRIYRRILANKKALENPIIAYIAQRPQVKSKK